MRDVGHFVLREKADFVAVIAHFLLLANLNDLLWSALRAIEEPVLVSREWFFGV